MRRTLYFEKSEIEQAASQRIQESQANTQSVHQRPSAQKLFQVELQILIERAITAAERENLPLQDYEIQTQHLLDDELWSHFAWPLDPARRGKYCLPSLYAWFAETFSHMHVGLRVTQRSHKNLLISFESCRVEKNSPAQPRVLHTDAAV